jgi:hypothetical protein
VRQTEQDRAGEARTLYNLSILLTERPGRLAEARSLAERSLALGQNLDHAAAEIWKTYNLLAKIADREGRPDAARDHRRRARAAMPQPRSPGRRCAANTP